MLSTVYPKYVVHREDGRRVVVKNHEEEFSATGVEVDVDGNPVAPPEKALSSVVKLPETPELEVKEEDIF